MNKKNMLTPCLLSIVIVFPILFVGIFYSVLAEANTNTSLTQKTQLAYFIGYHSTSRNSAYIYPAPKYRARGAYWTGWKYRGYSCQQSCLIDKWTGLVIQCRQRR